MKNKDWKERELGELVTIVSGNSPAIYLPSVKGKYPFVKVEDMNNNHRFQKVAREYSSVEKNVVPEGAVIFAKRGAAIATNKVRIAATDVVMDSNMMALIAGNEIDELFLFYFITEKNLWKIADTSSIPQINNKHIEPILVNLPNLSEQKNIARIIEVFDSAIEKTEQLIRLKEEHIKGMAQKLLLKSKKSIKVPLSDLFEKVNERNEERARFVLTVSGKHGLISQEHYFDKNIASENITNYYLLRKGDFVYNRSLMGGYPFGAIKRLDKYPMGAIPTLYICFKLKDKKSSNSDFYKHCFEFGVMNEALSKIIQVGARAHGLLNITLEDFFNIKIINPPIEEQDEKAELFNALEEEVKLLNDKKELLILQKKGLMQQLLTGKLRVKVKGDKNAK